VVLGQQALESLFAVFDDDDDCSQRLAAKDAWLCVWYVYACAAWQLTGQAHLPLLA
jgi:hypothetical protein